MKKWIRLLLMLFFAIIFLFSLWKLLGLLGDYRAGRESYQELTQYVSFEETIATVPPTTQETEEETEPFIPPDLSQWPQVDFEQLAEINEDIVGWIYIEDTKINYPVVQGEDNSFYMNHMFDGKYNSAGCIFMDYRCEGDCSGRNSILYGHHMKNKSMFAQLVNYKKQVFYEEHPVALLLTPARYYKIQLFSGYVSNNKGDAWDVRFTDESYAQWLEDLKKKSCFTSEFAPTEEDRIVTLSTCSYEFSGAKFVVHGYIAETVELLPPDER